MAKKSNGELLHFNAVRYRVVGSGNLETTLNSLDDTRTSALVDIAMVATTNREPTILANFIEQIACVEFRLSAIDETFTISKITIFMKQSATGYPQ